MNHSTAIGRLFRRDRQAARALVLRVLKRCKGNVQRASVELGYHTKRWLLQIIWREGLWTELDEIRAKHGMKARATESHELVDRARDLLARRSGPC